MRSAPIRCCNTRLFRASLARFLLILSFALGIGLGWAQAGFARAARSRSRRWDRLC